MCDERNIPHEYIYSIDQHNEEILNIVYSNNCNYFAAILKSNSIAIYKLDINCYSEMRNLEITLLNILNGHKSLITSLQWTPNDKYIITASKDKSIKIWCPYTSALKRTINSNESMISSIAIIDNIKFVSCGLDYKLSHYDINGNLEYYVPVPGLTVTEILYSDAFKYILIVSATTNSILIFNYLDKSEVSTIKLNDAIISCGISKQDKGKYLLVNSSKATPVINLICIESKNILRKYFGHRQERFSIKVSFGGENENFILSGSEDAKIYIWNRIHSIPILTIKTHSAAVNSVIWAYNYLSDCIISCSDDHTIKILTNEFVNKVSIQNKAITSLEPKIVNFDEIE
jgi:WD40 repeat protein